MGKSQTTTLTIEGLGEIRLSRRAGMRRIRLTVTPRGPLLSMPWYTPRILALNFLAKNKEWLLQNMHVHEQALIKPGARIGTTHDVRFVYTSAKSIQVRTTSTAITVAHPKTMSHDDPKIQTKLNQTAIRILKQQAEAYLPDRLHTLATNHGYSYSQVKVRRMTSRWGSCSSTRLITLNIFLMQLPVQLIDYVLIHELVHTKHMDHSAAFWQTFESTLPGAKKLRKRIKQYSPVLQPTYPST